MALSYALQIRPIAEAPVTAGVKYGPCALAPGINGREWITGEWDGEGWFLLTGETRLYPRYFALMPPIADLDATFGEASGEPGSG